MLAEDEPLKDCDAVRCRDSDITSRLHRCVRRSGWWSNLRAYAGMRRIIGEPRSDEDNAGKCVGDSGNSGEW